MGMCFKNGFPKQFCVNGISVIKSINQNANMLKPGF